MISRRPRQLLFLLLCTWACTVTNALSHEQQDSTAASPTGSDKLPLTAPPITGAAADEPQSDVGLATGSIAVRAVQGTEGAPPIGAAPVILQLVHSGSVVHSVEAELDEHGIAVIEGLPVGMGVVPIVRVEHADVLYQQPGTPMDATNRTQAIEVICYELTDQAPDWRFAMRHVMVNHDNDGLVVAEVVIVEHPGDRTWSGEPDGELQGATCVVPIPRGATDVGIGKGFLNWNTTILQPGRLISKLPLMPGTTELNFRYRLPVHDSHALVDLTMDRPVTDLMVVIPNELETQAVEGLLLGGTDAFENHVVRYYRASALNDGDSIRLQLGGFSNAASVSVATASANRTTSGMVKIVAGVAAGLLVVLAAVVLFMRKPSQTDATE